MSIGTEDISDMEMVSVKETDAVAAVRVPEYYAKLARSAREKGDRIGSRYYGSMSDIAARLLERLAEVDFIDHGDGEGRDSVLVLGYAEQVVIDRGRIEASGGGEVTGPLLTVE